MFSKCCCIDKEIKISLAQKERLAGARDKSEVARSSSRRCYPHTGLNLAFEQKEAMDVARSAPKEAH